MRERRGLEVGERAAEAECSLERAGDEEWMCEGEAGRGTAPLALAAPVVVVVVAVVAVGGVEEEEMLSLRE